MSEDTPKDVKNNVISLVHTKEDLSKDKVEPIDSSLEWVYEFIDEFIEVIARDSVSPITGVAIVVTHEDNGVSHAHKCERDVMTQLIGAMELKKLRLAMSFELEKK